MDAENDDESAEELQLRNILDKTEHLENQAVSKSEDALMKDGAKLLQEADKIMASSCKKMKNTSGMITSMRILQKNQSIASKLLKRHRGSKVDVYLKALRAHVDEHGWSSFAKTVASTSTAALCSYHPGPLSAEDIVVNKQKRQPRATINPSQLKEPERCTRTEESEEERAHAFYEKLCKLYTASGQKIPFYKIIINPHSFWETISNGFQMAFLWREGKISISAVEDDPYPQVRLLTKTEHSVAKQDKSYSNIFSITSKIYSDVIEYYNIEEPLL